MDGLEGLFDSYDSDLQAVLSSISTKLAGDAAVQRGELRKASFGRIERELEEADEIIAQMAIEVQTATTDISEMQRRLAASKATLSKHKAELRSLMSTADRDDLLSTSTRPHSSSDLEMQPTSESAGARTQQQQRLLSMSDKLSEGQRRLEDSHRIALETENVGSGILRDLRGQRETLEHTRDHLYEADGSIDRASNTLKKMFARMYQQRLITYAIIGILVFLIGYVIFSKLFSS